MWHSNTKQLSCNLLLLSEIFFAFGKPAICEHSRPARIAAYHSWNGRATRVSPQATPPCFIQLPSPKDCPPPPASARGRGHMHDGGPTHRPVPGAEGRPPPTTPSPPSPGVGKALPPGSLAELGWPSPSGVFHPPLPPGVQPWRVVGPSAMTLTRGRGGSG